MFHYLSYLTFLIFSLGFHMPQKEAAQQKQNAGLQDQLVAKLGSGHEEQRMDLLVQLGALFTSAPGTITQSTITAVSDSLHRDSSPVIRALAARVLELGGDASAVGPLLAAMEKEREFAVRKAIIYALAPYPSSLVTATLITLLKDKKNEIRAAAAYGLAESGDPLATAELTEFLQRRGKVEDAFARSQAARGLGKIANRESMEPLLKSLKTDKSEEVRREAARSLGRIATRQDVKVIDALRKATLSSDPYLTMAADDALAIINSRPI